MASQDDSAGIGMGLHELSLSKESDRRDQPSFTQVLVDSVDYDKLH
jgi:hypothetical protein